MTARTTRFSRAIKIAITALGEVGDRFSAIAAASERIQTGKRTRGTHLEDSASVVGAAGVSSAIEIAVAALCQPCLWICAVVDAREGIQICQRTVGVNLEHGATAECAAIVSCAIEGVAVCAHKTGKKSLAIIAAGERV